VAYNLTKRAKELSQSSVIEPNLALEIDGVPFIFGVRNASKRAKFGQDNLVFGQPGLVFGGLVQITNSRDWIALQGTTSTIRQQLEPDKGAISSTQKITVKILDVDGYMSKLVSPGKILDDLLYTTATVSLGFVQGSFPKDYITLVVGKITEIKPSSGAVELVISNPEDIKRAKIFNRVTANLTQNFYYQSVDVTDLNFSQKSDELGLVEVEYINAGFVGQNPTVNVVPILGGSKIQVGIEPGVTIAKAIREKVNNNAQANQIVSCARSTNGNLNNTQITQGPVALAIQTTLYLDDVSLFLPEYAPDFETYVQLNEEICRYTTIDTVNNTLTITERGALNTFPANHKDEDEASSFYVLGDNTSDSNAIDLSLKVYMSGAPEFYKEQLIASQVNYISPALTVQNAIFYPGIDINYLISPALGDFVDLTTSAFGNNFTGRTIIDVVVLDIGSYIVVDGAPLVTETNSTLETWFKSQYNVLPDGLGLTPREVEISEFQAIKQTFFSSLPPYRIYLKDTVDGKEFVDKEIFLPASLYSLPRKGKLSVKKTSPPLYGTEIKDLNLDNIKNPDQISITRTTQSNFYNSIVYRINEDSIEDKLLNGYVTLSTGSTTRIKAPNKPYTITAKGLRPSPSTEALIRRLSRDYLSRYQYGAEFLSVEVPFNVGFSQEVGDPVVFGDPALHISDSLSGDASFAPRLFEITDREYNWTNGKIRLKLTDTSTGSDTRVGVYSPSSNVVSGSTTTLINIEDSFGIDITQIEKDKWQNFIGYPLRIHSKDWSYNEPTVLRGFTANNNYQMIVDALPTPPPAGCIVEIGDYEDINNVARLFKQIYVFISPVNEVISVSSPAVFSVSNISDFYVGCKVRIFNDDYSRDSGEVGLKVVSIAGSEINVNPSPSFLPVVGDKIQVLNFVSDQGKSYSYL
jgi:hypothetical protein